MFRIHLINGEHQAIGLYSSRLERTSMFSTRVMKVLFQAQTKFAFTKEVLEGFNNINTNVIPNFFEKSTIKPIYASSGGPRI